ncbi:MAG: hypothetical protein RTU63_13075, partial [Candidatus Thorarchaeota archaeon]
NGNRIGCFGYPTYTATNLSAAFVEVNEAGDIVWETKLFYDEDYIYGAYRLERFRYTPIIDPIEDVLVATFEPTLEWDVFYNYRNKEELPGSYTLFIDDVAIDSGAFVYSQFWKPTTLSLALGHLDYGIHNATLQISDGYGHYTTDSVNVTVETFYIERDGMTIVEKGQQTLLPTWQGASSQEYLINITLNGILHSEFNWTGADIVLDPVSIAVGAHLVELQMFNQSEVLYSDSFWLYVEPMEPPVITPLQSTTLNVEWGELFNVSWDIEDTTGKNWSLYLDGSLVAENNWDPPTTRVNWTTPLLLDDSYNLTLVVYDLIGQISISETNLTILPPTHPHIISSPGYTIVVWGFSGATLEWTTYGATTWEIDKNGVFIESGDVIDNSVEFTITEWRDEDWRPGIHSVTLTLYLDDTEATDTITVEVVANPGDAYVDALVTSRCDGYNFGDNIIGAPDGLSAFIYVDYSNGYITVDMGENEEIIDESGFDFTVIASGGNYSIFVGNSLEVSLEFLARGSGNTSFDLSTSSHSVVRYLRIEMFLGDNATIDAVVAINYNLPPADESAPSISAIGDVEMFLSEENTTLTWTPSDATPWTYEIYINGTLDETDWWHGGSITYQFEPQSAGLWNVTIIVYDAFTNSASDSVLVLAKLDTTPQTSPDSPVLLILATVGIGIAATVIIFIVYRKK